MVQMSTAFLLYVIFYNLSRNPDLFGCDELDTTFELEWGSGFGEKEKTLICCQILIILLDEFSLDYYNKGIGIF